MYNGNLEDESVNDIIEYLNVKPKISQLNPKIWKLLPYLLEVQDCYTVAYISIGIEINRNIWLRLLLHYN